MKNRYGDTLDDDPVVASRATTTHDPRCRSGWLGEDLDGRIIPCLRCRPHLIRTQPATGAGVWP